MDSLISVLLIVLLIVPTAAAIVVALLGPNRRMAVRCISLVAVLINLAITLVVLIQAVPALWAKSGGPTFRPDYVTMVNVLPLGQAGASPIQFYIGLDGLNIWLIAITSMLMLPSVLISWESIKERSNEYYAWLLLLQTTMSGVFLSFDLILFYVFFELTLVPLYFLIGIWGGAMRREASRKFFLYTLAGSLITLLGILAVVLICQQHSGSGLTFSIPELVRTVQGFLNSGQTGFYGLQVQTWIFLALAVGFAVKVPLFPLHTWLPLAHTEAPTAGSVLLAGVLLKVGTYGFLRLCIPLTPDAALVIGVPLIGTLASIGVIYGAMCAYAQTDIKKMVAYSSVSHLGVCMLGLFALNEAGLTGGLLQMINHALSTGGLFLLVGMLYERYHTREMAQYSGMAAKLKVLATFMMFVCLTSIGLPGLNGFIGEMFTFAGVFDLRAPGATGHAFAVALALGVIMGMWYLITMIQKVFFGPLKEPHHEGYFVGDLNTRELFTIVPIMVLCLLIGVFPQPLIDSTKTDIGVVVRFADQARNRVMVSAAQPAIVQSDPNE